MDRVNHLWPDIADQFLSPRLWKEPNMSSAWFWACACTSELSGQELCSRKGRTGMTRLSITTLVLPDLSRYIDWDAGPVMVSCGLFWSAWRGHLSTYQYLSMLYPGKARKHCISSFFGRSRSDLPISIKKKDPLKLVEQLRDMPKIESPVYRDMTIIFLKEWGMTPDDVLVHYGVALREAKDKKYPDMEMFLKTMGAGLWFSGIE